MKFGGWLAGLLLAMPVQAETFDMRLGVWEVSTQLKGVSLPVVERACVTRPDLMPFVHGPDTIEDDPCKPSGAARVSRRRWAVSLRCQDGSQMHAEFNSGGAERFSGAMVRIGGKHALAQRVDIKGRWTGGDCRGVR